MKRLHQPNKYRKNKAMNKKESMCNFTFAAPQMQTRPFLSLAFSISAEFVFVRSLVLLFFSVCNQIILFVHGTLFIQTALFSILKGNQTNINIEKGRNWREEEVTNETMELKPKGQFNCVNALQSKPKLRR